MQLLLHSFEFLPLKVWHFFFFLLSWGRNLEIPCTLFQSDSPFDFIRSVPNRTSLVGDGVNVCHFQWNLFQRRNDCLSLFYEMQLQRMHLQHLRVQLSPFSIRWQNHNQIVINTFRDTIDHQPDQSCKISSMDEKLGK